MLCENNIKAFSIFSNLDPPILSAITKSAKQMFYKKGSILYDIHHNENLYFYFIVKGWIKLFTVSQEGTEIIKDILTDKHHFNEELLFEENFKPLSAQAISDIQIISIPIATLKQILYQNPQLSLNLLRESLQKQRELTHEIEHLSIQSATQRIGCALLRLCPIGTSKAIRLHLPYDKALLAARLGMCPETFSRALAKLSKLCNICVNHEFIHIPDIDKLNSFVCRQCSLRYPCHISPLSINESSLRR